MLGAFLGPDLHDWVCSSATSLDVYRNHWLVRKSAAATMSHGFFQFKFGKGPEYEILAVTIGGPALPPIMDNIPLFRRACFTDYLTPGMHNPDVSALQILSQFANPIRWSFVAREISARKPKAVARLPSSSLWTVVLDHGVTALMFAWRLVPAPIRIQAYRGLAFLGAHIYGSSCSLNVQQLPFGLYLKTSSVTFHKSLVNEFGALQLVRYHTQIPVPRPLDLVSNSIYSYLLTSKTPGVRLGSCIDTLSDAEAKTLVCDLQKCVSELRALPKDVAPAYAITNALGDACYDHRIIAGSDWVDTRDGFVGPFVNEKFNEALRLGALPAVSHRGGHAIVFTHGDLNMRNVLMQNIRLSGIVDWETSGWYPEYWEFTKAHFVTKLNRRWLSIVDEVFEHYGDFKEELSTERQLWHYCF